MNIFKKIIIVASTLVIACNMMVSVFADNGKVTYSGDSGKFIFAPGSEYSPTDLFPNFKDVMPGDSITQQITVKNDASNKVKVKIYMRSLGAKEGSEQFLSQLGLRVEKVTDTVLFDATAEKSAQLTDWVCLGTLYSGGTADLNVTLDVPVTLDNTFKDLVGYIDWEFMIEELPIESTDPTPETGDNSNMLIWSVCLVASAAVIIILLLKRNREDEKEKN